MIFLTRKLNRFLYQLIRFLIGVTLLYFIFYYSKYDHNIYFILIIGGILFLPLIVLYINYHFITRNLKVSVDKFNNIVTIINKNNNKSIKLTNNNLKKVFYTVGPENGLAPWNDTYYFRLLTKSGELHILTCLDIDNNYILQNFKFTKNINYFPFILNIKHEKHKIDNYFNMVSYYIEKYNNLNKNSFNQIIKDDEKYHNLNNEERDAIIEILNNTGR